MPLPLPSNMAITIDTVLQTSTFADILRKLLSVRGQIVTIDAERPLKMRKDYQHINGTKRTTFQARAGVVYDNLAKVMEKRMLGDLPAANADLVGRMWVLPPYVLCTTSTNPKMLFRFYVVDNAFKTRISYTLDGRDADISEIMEKCLSSEWKERDREETCFDYPLDCITAVR